jgi:hypothetical protein
MRIERVQPGSAGVPARVRGAPPGFGEALRGAGEEPDAPAAAGLAGAGAAAPILAASVEAAEEALERADRAARRHGRAMLQALAGLQLAMLGDDAAGGTAARERLAALVGGMPAADDPVLRLILREIGARAAVELARAPR